MQTPKRITASGVVCTGLGRVRGFLVASTTAGTLTLYDGLSAGGTQITGVITPTAGLWVDFLCNFTTGLFVTVGGTIDVTFISDY